MTKKPVGDKRAKMLKMLYFKRFIITKCVRNDSPKFIINAEKHRNLRDNSPKFRQTGGMTESKYM